VASAYPDFSAARDRWIVQQRPNRSAVDAARPYACLIEEERSSTGEIVPMATVFLTNRECPWRCLMCDLWKNTLTESVPVGAIPKQIDYALSELAGTESTPRQIKLYNSGSFFDPRAIPPEDYPAIVERIKRFERVIVECHPSLVNDRILQFRDRLGTHLEIAMGLETVHPEVLPRLNKRMTMEQFAAAAHFLKTHGISLRAFVLVKPPFLDDSEALLWAKRSVDFAFDCSATVVSLIPTRPGNGALEVLAAANEFTPPRLETLEAAVEYGIGLGRGRVFGDLWDLEQFSKCPACLSERHRRLTRMNHRQVVEQAVPCSRCT
jgi:radical SAM enzyme (TIGR01210 family)